jgi:hypothetical protein
MTKQRLISRRPRTALKVLAVFLVVGLAVGLTSHKAYAATPPQGLPNNIETYVNGYDTAPPTANLYLDDSWISPTTNESKDLTDTDITYGQPNITLQVNELIFLYHTLVNGGTGSCTGGDGAPLPCDGTPNSSVALTSQQELINSITYTSSDGGANEIGPLSSNQTSIAYTGASRYWFNAPLPTFTYTPGGGQGFVSPVTVTFTLTYTQINTYHGTTSDCVTGGGPAGGASDFGNCGSASRMFQLQFDPPANVGNPPQGGWVAACDELHGFAQDPDDPSASLAIQVTNSTTGYTDYLTANQAQYSNPAGSNDGFDLASWPSSALSSTNDNIITVQAENVTNEGEGIGFSPLNYNDTTSDTYNIGACPNGTGGCIGIGTCGPPSLTVGSATCPTSEPGFNPSRLPYDPGETTSVTVGINYVPPSGQSGLPQDNATYTVYSQGQPPPSIQVTEPSWWSGDSGATTTSYTTPSATIPTTTPTGTFDVDWTFTWAVAETTYHWTPAVGNTAGYYTPTLSTATEQKTCTWPGNTTGNSQQCTATAGCIAYYPYYRVYGGDISAGGTCADSEGGIYGWPTLSSASTSWLGGAGTQFAESALGIIEGAASAANVAETTNPNSGTPGTPNGGAPTGLSFSNQNTAAATYDYGGCSDGADTSDHTATYYYAQEPTDAADLTLWAGGPLSTPTTPATSDNYYTTGDINISGGTIPAGVHVKVYVQGNVEISDNIEFGTGATTTTDIPTLWIIATGSIGIDHNVTRLDGVYAAEQNINTCGDTSTTDANFYTDCKSQLTINGSLIADANVYLDRTYGTVSKSTTNDPGTNSAAEIINYNPLLFLPTQSGLGSSDDAINSLPPVL